MRRGRRAPSILNNVFTANASYAVSVDTASFPTLSGNTLTNNGGNGMEDPAAGPTAANSVWDQTSVVYAVEGDVLVATGVTLTMSSGLVVKFRGDGPGSNGYGVVGNQRNLFVDGTLIADGTLENPIYLTSLRDDVVGGDTNNDSANTVPGV